jgi:hypothetical protein
MKKKYDLPYKEQLARITRLNNELKKYSVANDEIFDEAIDAFTSFFIQCYHLADWLKNSGYSEKDIYGFINQSDYLSLCHSLANLQKHQKGHNHSKQQEECKFCDAGGFSDFGITTPIMRQYNHFKGGKYEFVILATKFAPFPLPILDLSDMCIKEWIRFLENNPDPSTSVKLQEKR